MIKLAQTVVYFLRVTAVLIVLTLILAGSQSRADWPEHPGTPSRGSSLDEATWWEKAGIDPTLNARALWLQTHPVLINSNISASDANCSMAQNAIAKG